MAIRVELWTSNIKITWYWFANMRVSRVKSETRQAYMEGGAKRKKQIIPYWSVVILNSKGIYLSLSLGGYKMSKSLQRPPGLLKVHIEDSRVHSCRPSMWFQHLRLSRLHPWQQLLPWKRQAEKSKAWREGLIVRTLRLSRSRSRVNQRSHPPSDLIQHLETISNCWKCNFFFLLGIRPTDL